METEIATHVEISGNGVAARRLIGSNGKVQAVIEETSDGSHALNRLGRAVGAGAFLSESRPVAVAVSIDEQTPQCSAVARHISRSNCQGRTRTDAPLSRCIPVV